MAKLRKKSVKNNGFWKINAIRPEIRERQGRTGKVKLREKANWGGMAKELCCQIVTQNLNSETRKAATQIEAEWRTFHRQFLIPQTATFCIAMDAKRNSSFAAKIKNGVRNMRSTFNILFYVNI